MKKFIVLLGLMIVCPLCFGDSEGVLEIVNVTEPFTYPGRIWIIHSFSENATDDFDDEPLDIELNYNDLIWPAAFLYSEISTSGHKLLRDTRPADGTQDVFFLFFATYGEPVAMKNRLVVNFYETYPPPPEPPFDNKQIILVSDHLKYGYAVDVRAAIDKGGIQLENITRTNSAWLLIGDGHYLADINRDCICNFEDFTMLAADWQKPQGKHRGDISGQYGVPDGYVDGYDLKVFTEKEWLTYFWETEELE